MLELRTWCWLVLALLVPLRRLHAQQSGSIRGLVLDREFDAPLPGAQITNVELGTRVLTSESGNFLFPDVPPGTYTLVFSKDGYVRQVRANVVVRAGLLTDVDLALSGEFTEMEEFIVQDVLRLGAGGEAELLALRFESPALMNSISSELMSRAGASDAASALRLVSGASVQGGKFAVIRGLPDRYVSSQMNGVRLPSADEDKRAVELDQFPSSVIDAIDVRKTFTPDQQGDASGGAIDVRLKSIPEESGITLKLPYIYNEGTSGRDDFLTYRGGGVDTWARDDGGRDVQTHNLGSNWDGAAGVSKSDAPVDWKFALSGGGKHEFGDDLRIGGFVSLFYERDSSFHDDGVDDSYWVTTPGAGMTPETVQGTPNDGDFKTALFDVEQGSQSVRWGGLATVGLESDHHTLALTYLATRSAEDVATLAQDTRGKAYFFPGYDPNDPTGTGNQPGQTDAAPYLRLETLEYTERTTGTLQLSGEHELPGEGALVGAGATLATPQLAWTVARSDAGSYQPDKRQFGALWHAPSFNPGIPPFVPPFTTPATWFPYKPAANFNLGNFQRIWKDIDESSEQIAIDLKLPFSLDGGGEGYLKLGMFDDSVRRSFDQDTFSNFGDAGASFGGTFGDSWSAAFPGENHPITASDFDVDYRGKLDVSAWYSMIDVPLGEHASLVGGARVERTAISVVNSPEASATWFPKGATAPVDLDPGEGNVSFAQSDVLPALALSYEPLERVTLRASYSQTVARQTFKELTPILQQEYLGSPIFIGNPELGMSSLENYDLRADYEPYDGALLSASWFKKSIDAPIEYVQRIVSFTFTTAENYPRGELSGFEFEARQDLGNFSDALEGLTFGANATFIDSRVDLPASEIAGFNLPNIQAPMSSRDMTNAPEHLYNLFLTYDLPDAGTQLALFYTVQGDTLLAGAGQSNGNFVPSVYATEFDTLNLSCMQRLGKYVRLQLQAKNLTDPEIETVYRSQYIDGDVTKTSYSKGIEFSISLGAEFSF
ncbi:MAG: TonB-dependent receptor [Planctomycetes bacterium]|nr:TonB-dependent receptor [Planctomycetota bacterium]